VTRAAGGNKTVCSPPNQSTLKAKRG